MKNTFKLSLISLMLLIFQSFTVESNNTIFGTYGVSNNDPSGIELVINENLTFSYTDFSNPQKKINTSGTWKIIKGFVVLSSTNYEGTFHNKWKFNPEGEIAKSRKGLTYYTLCKSKTKH